MAQFTQYSSTDASGPGVITGVVGSLLTILDACLVNGYSGKAAAGWTKPFANTTNFGCYKQGAGAGFTLFVNDNGVVSAANADMTGWKTLTAMTTPVGAGTGQFPLPAQLLTTGKTVLRKSAAASGVGRTWTIFADSSTFYMFILTGDTAGLYSSFMFGDIFSLWGATDANRCMIIGLNNEVSSAPLIINGGVARSSTPLVTNGQQGPFLADNFGSTSGSQQAYPSGDISKNAVTLNTAGGGCPTNGGLPTPNSSDNSYYLSPMWVMDASFLQRGRLRGFYHLCHPNASFSDGMTFTGANDFAGKTFIVLVSDYSGGLICIETSNTLETN